MEFHVKIYENYHTNYIKFEVMIRLQKIGINELRQDISDISVKYTWRESTPEYLRQHIFNSLNESINFE